MKFLFNKILILSFFFILFSFYAFAENKKAEYVIEIGKIDIGKIYWTIDIVGNKYNTSINVENTGLLSGLYSFSGKYSASGNINDGAFISSKYAQFWKTKKKKKDVTINFEKGVVSTVFLSPKEDRVPKKEYINTPGLTDPLSSFLNILYNGKSKLNTIDGRRLYKMNAEKKLYKNNVLSTIITINNYTNIWADHDRNDLNYIEIIRLSSKKSNIFPYKIKIKHKSLVYDLTKI